MTALESISGAGVILNACCNAAWYEFVESQAALEGRWRSDLVRVYFQMLRFNLFVLEAPTRWVGDDLQGLGIINERFLIRLPSSNATKEAASRL